MLKIFKVKNNNAYFVRNRPLQSFGWDRPQARFTRYSAFFVVRRFVCFETERILHQVAEDGSVGPRVLRVESESAVFENHQVKGFVKPPWQETLCEDLSLLLYKHFLQEVVALIERHQTSKHFSHLLNHVNIRSSVSSGYHNMRYTATST